MIFEVGPASLDDPQVVRLVELHQQAMLDSSPPGTSFALDLSGLSSPGITMLAVWEGERLAAVGALKRHDGNFGEIKSMRAHHDFLGKGAGRVLLEEIIAIARREGMFRLSLETGRGPIFEPALSLYRAYGFAKGEAFANYENGDFNQCFHLDL